MVPSLPCRTVPSSSDIICLLDDEPSVLRSLGRLLASEGLTALKFADPPSFLRYAGSHPVRLAVVDIRMPGMTGIDVLEELRVLSPDTRTIIMTGESDAIHRTAALAAGAVSFFLKPFDDEAFLQAVRAVMVRPPWVAGENRGDG